MSEGVIVAITTSATSLLLALINAIIAWMQRRQQKKNGIQKRLDAIERKVDKLSEYNDLQYLSLLRLTVMDSDMPMSERLIAGKEYLSRGGNGDVKSFYEKLERDLNHK